MEFQRINTTNLLFSYNQKLNAENPCLKGARVNNNMGYRVLGIVTSIMIN